jgi:cytochrome c oxidase assembly factor 1
MPPRLPFRKPLEALFKRNNASNPLTPRRTLIAAPKPNSGPLMERRADRALPDMTPSKSWMITAPLFLAAMAASTLAIFNYQKQNSSVVTSTMYSLRTNAVAREILGDEVYFASKIPYIGGEINQLHGKIDVVYWVKGTRQEAKMRFKSHRKTRMGIVSLMFWGKEGMKCWHEKQFETTEWSLELVDGTVIDLLNATDSDPFVATPMEAKAIAAEA